MADKPFWVFQRSSRNTETQSVCDSNRSEFKSEHNRREDTPPQTVISQQHEARHTVPGAGSVHIWEGRCTTSSLPPPPAPRSAVPDCMGGPLGRCRQVEGAPPWPPPCLSSCTALWSQTQKPVQIHTRAHREHARIKIHTCAYTHIDA